MLTIWSFVELGFLVLMLMAWMTMIAGRSGTIGAMLISSYSVALVGRALSHATAAGIAVHRLLPLLHRTG